MRKKDIKSQEIVIVEYLPEHRSAFKALNLQWISTYFKVEEADRKALDNPEDNILNKGGQIVVATENNQVVGVCALIKMQDSKYDFELAKMAVCPKSQGKGVGYLLGKAITQKAKSLGASYLYLESNTLLQPAISLYKKLGFQPIEGHHTPYERCDIQMELKL